MHENSVFVSKQSEGFYHPLVRLWRASLEIRSSQRGKFLFILFAERAKRKKPHPCGKVVIHCSLVLQRRRLIPKLIAFFERLSARQPHAR
jgi:hypothetical protein